MQLFYKLKNGAPVLDEISCVITNIFAPTLCPIYCTFLLLFCQNKINELLVWTSKPMVKIFYVPMLGLVAYRYTFNNSSSAIPSNSNKTISRSISLSVQWA